MLTSVAGCDSIVTLNLTITPTEDATFAYGASSYCASATDPTPTVSGVSGGVFSSTTGLVINSSTGAIDLDSSTAGTYTVTYSTSSTEQTISTSIYLQQVLMLRGLMCMRQQYCQMGQRVRIPRRWR